jgi:hypothetical protein
MQFSHPKLSEAEFFIELLEATQQRTTSLTRNSTLAVEASFIFAGVLNAFYSALEQWKEHVSAIDYQNFIKKFPEIYSHSHKGGWRSTTVHVQHVPISYAGYIPPNNREIPIDFEPPPKLASPEVLNDEIDSVHVPYYYMDFRGKRHQVASFAREHLETLREFMATRSQAGAA